MSTFDYPVPIYAAAIWMGQNELCLALPGESGKSHIIRFPLAKCQHDDRAWTAGWAGLIRVLKDRLQNNRPEKIGKPGEITQWQLTEIMKTFPVTMVGKRDAPEDLSLAELDL